LSFSEQLTALLDCLEGDVGGGDEGERVNFLNPEDLLYELGGDAWTKENTEHHPVEQILNLGHAFFTDG